MAKQRAARASPRPSGRWRRSPYLVCYWEGRQLVLCNFFTGVRATADPLAVRVLAECSAPQTFPRLLDRFPEFSPSSVRRSLKELVKLTFLEADTPEARARDRKMRLWSNWEIEAPFFHWATKDVNYLRGPEDMARIERRLVAKSRQPPFFKHYPAARQIRLPAPRLDRIRPLADVLRARRTNRLLRPSPLALEDLATLLKLTWAPVGYYNLARLGRVPVKTSPSGGARHPIEVYVAAFRVAGLRPGLYHYAADRHRLELLKRGQFSSRAERWCGNQWWTRNAGALFLMTARFERTMWRYHYSRVYRVIQIEAGHLCQTLLLTATALGLAPFSLAALADSRIEKDLGLDGISESVLYLAGVGHRQPKLPPRFPRVVPID